MLLSCTKDRLFWKKCSRDSPAVNFFIRQITELQEKPKTPLSSTFHNNPKITSVFHFCARWTQGRQNQKASASVLWQIFRRSPSAWALFSKAELLQRQPPGAALSLTYKPQTARWILFKPEVLNRAFIPHYGGVLLGKICETSADPSRKKGRINICVIVPSCRKCGARRSPRGSNYWASSKQNL